MSPQQNVVPGLTLAAPQDASRATMNNNALIRWGKTVSPRMLAADTPLISFYENPPPTPPSDAYLHQNGTQLVTFTAGFGTLTLPQPYVNGVLTGWVNLVYNGVNWYFVSLYNPSAITTTTIPLVALTDAFAGATTTINVAYGFTGW